MDISQKKTVQNTQDTVHRTPKAQQAEVPNEDTSVPLGREKKAIISGEGGKDLGGKVGRDWRGEGNLIWYWVWEND